VILSHVEPGILVDGKRDSDIAQHVDRSGENKSLDLRTLVLGSGEICECVNDGRNRGWNGDLAR
jgi:hypothetical protein